MSSENDDLFLDPLAKRMARNIPRGVASVLMRRPTQILDSLRARFSEILANEINLVRWALHEAAVPLQRQEELLSTLGSRMSVRLMRFLELQARGAPFDQEEEKMRRDLDGAKSASDILRVIADAMEKEKGLS